MRLRKKTIAVTTAAFVIAGTTAALAFWTTSGSGSGSATAASGAGSVVLHADFPTNTLTPGTSVPVTITGDNLNDSSLQVSTISATVSIDQAHVDLGCLASDFSMADATTSVTLLPGDTGVFLTDAVLAMDDTAVSQDGCKGATITLNLTSA